MDFERLEVWQRARALTVDTDGRKQVDDRRTSAGMFFRLGESPLIERIESRLAALLSVPVSHGEGRYVAEPSQRATVFASSFAAALELVREGELELNQKQPFAPIFFRKRPPRPPAAAPASDVTVE